MAVSNKFGKLQQLKFDLFKLQDPDVGQFDVIFEIEGKRLFAHKTMLNLVSDTFSSMLSDRWTSKNEPIKLQNYTFDAFYQFLTFLYSAQCQLTAENIIAMVDIAEFYHVELLKEYCDEFLSNTTFTTENIFHFSELSDKYSLIQLKAAVESYMNKFSNLGNSAHFMNLGKLEVEKFLIAFKDKAKPEELFQVVYKWAENKMLQNLADNPMLDQHDAIRLEIVDFLCYFDFNKMDMCFLIQFVVPRGFIFTHNELAKILCHSYSKDTNVTVTNIYGKKATGNLMPNQTVLDAIKTLTSFSSGIDNGFWKKRCEIPTTPSLLEKRDSAEYYLLYMADGHVGIKKHHSVVESELIPEKDFIVTANCKIKVE
uniref:BTB domain-containing protein n=1 Tax=Panagrolaimus davidi TaxID=227884 RepID=A0A914QP23_9BILA